MDFNPLSPESRANPYPGYALLREEAPVHEIQPFGVFAVSRYDDILYALKHPDIYSSAGMRAMMSGQTGMMGSSAPKGRMGAVLEVENLIASDPPVHDRLRSIVNRGFTPRRIAELEPRIRKIAEEAIDSVAASGQMELVRDLAVPVPVRVIADILGVPNDLMRDFKRWSDAIISSATGVSQDENAELHFKEREEFLEYFAKTISDRKKSPSDDLISTLIRADDSEGTLSEAEILSFTTLLLVAGNETTTNLLGNTMLALTEHPDQLDKVLAEPSLIPNLVEEALRYDSPVQGIFRQTACDTELAGVKIPSGKLVMLLLGSANRDESWLPNANQFDVTRDLKSHIGFGFGVHFCLPSGSTPLLPAVMLRAAWMSL